MRAGQRGGHSPRHITSGGAAAVAFVVVLLIAATTSSGAFAISRWAPLALITLAVLLGATLSRTALRVPRGPVLAMLGGIWGLAVWSLLSVLWAKSRASAFAATDRTILYAAVATLPFALPVGRRTLAAAGWTLCAGIGLVAVWTLLHLLAGGFSWYLAGRLNGPVNYRNATALLFAMPVWPFLIAAATRDYRRIVRASGLSLATLCLGLAWLTQSRGIVIGLGIAGIVALAAGPERIRRAWVMIVAVGGVALASHWLLAPFHAFAGGHGTVTHHDVTIAALALAALTVAAFLVGFCIALFDLGLRAGSPRMREVHIASRTVLAIGVLVAVVGALAVAGNPISFAHRKWDEFTSLQYSTSSSTRLLSTGGQRYDLWRVAVKEFRGAPLQGVGADNYAFGYYQQRATDRNLGDPHSLLFAVLAENGLVGIALLALFLGGIGAAVARCWRRLDPGAQRHALAPVTAGVVLVGQSMVDWMWLIPGLTAVGVLLLAIGAAQANAGEREAEPVAAKPVRAAVRAAVAVPLLAAIVSVLALYMYDAYLQKARSATGNPTAELSAARTASRLDPWSLTPHYLEASAYESLGRLSLARSQLQKALSLEPDNFATLGVLGDFEARGGNITAARAFYRRALALNPRDTGLQQLANIGLRRGG